MKQFVSLHCLVAASLSLLVPHFNEAAAQQVSPAESLQFMTVPSDFEVQLTAGEPLVRQPVCIEFDDRGRLWVIQYLQYPNPEGLTRVTVDRYSRTKYDHVPEPPPRGPRGADRITILEDTDEDGVMDEGHDFIDGLNLATGIAFGHGGVFVLNVPYLLFYPDLNRDDVPDSDPEVLLTGFGMEDAHSVANSLTWGPDGWLYGCQGSTVTATIGDIEFQQGVWRYHPKTREFELFCEGGGNTWGLDFDESGRLFYSTNYGGYVLVHGLQGGYFVKSFAKHGALHNPHAYGYFEHALHAGFRGGHVTVGGIVYQGDVFPESMRGRYIAGDLLGHAVHWHDIIPQGSTVQTAHGGELLVSSNPWFAPTDVTMGPDGAIYVSDWQDARTAHPDPDAEWDRSNGRIYRIAPKESKRAEVINFATLSVDELLRLHDHRSQWFVRHARQELVRRGDHSQLPVLKLRAANHQDAHQAIEALWTIASLNDFDESLAMELLDSPHPVVRTWIVRLLGDRRTLSTEMAHRLDELAEQEPAIEVRQQLASSAARWPPDQAMPVINANINRDIDNGDARLPLLWWWAVERHSISGRQEVMKRFVRPSLWKSKLGRDTLLPRLIRRYMAEGTVEGLRSVAELFAAAPDEPSRIALWNPALQGWQDMPPGALFDVRASLIKQNPLFKQVLSDWMAHRDQLTVMQMAISMGHPQPLEAALAEAGRDDISEDRRVLFLRSAGNHVGKSSAEYLLKLVHGQPNESVALEAVNLLGRIDDSEVTAQLIQLHLTLASDVLRSQIRSVLLSRRYSALEWLSAVDRGEIAASVTPLEQIRQVTFLDDDELNAIVFKHWGQVSGVTPEEKLAEVRRLNNDLRAGTGDLESGQLLFRKHCAACHQLFGEGTKLGPDLTTANRSDRDFMLVSMVDPSGVIRREYVSVIVQTVNGQIETGLAVTRDDAGITIITSKNEKRTFPVSEIEEIRESPVSHMPQDLYRQLKPQELRDLFAWLQSR